MLALAVIGGAAFAPAWAAGFLADDYVLLAAVRKAAGIGWIFRRNDLGEAGAGHFYRPLWLTVNAALYHLFGASPTAFHLLSLVLYVAITLGVFVLARRFAGPDRAFLVALLFAVYPRHGESVSWISRHHRSARRGLRAGGTRLPDLGPRAGRSSPLRGG